MTLPELFADSLERRPDRIGLEWQGRTLTFGDIDRRATLMARTLAARGLVAGDRLAVYLPNRLEVIDLFLACTRLGVIVVPTNVLYRERELGHMLTDAAPRAIVAAGAVPADTNTDVWSVDDLAAEAESASSDPIARAALTGDSPAALVYTSGTTGLAKGAIVTHGNLAQNARTLIEAWRITEDDRLWLALPLFHVHGLGNGIHCWLASGLRMRLLERFEHQTAAADLLDFAPTLFFGVPTMYVRLLETDPEMALTIGRTMRLFVSGSAPLPAQVLEAFRDRFGHTILERYGMTETLMTLSNPLDAERRPGTVGLPLPGVQVRLLTPEGRPAQDDELGELYVSSGTVCAGYWRRPDAWTASLQDGFFRTGDLATRSSDGYFTLHGRRGDLIISGGFNIYPREIEEVLLEHPSIAEAAVVGAPDAVRGEVPVAFIVVRTPHDGSAPSLDALALEAHCRNRLASFKAPRAFIPVEALPRTALGKIQKHLLDLSRRGC
jgi:malonyl-CoA/methylmalonyl-CoA synthetase